MPKNLTISLDDDLAEKVEKYREINWSEVCRNAIRRYIQENIEREGMMAMEIADGLKPYNEKAKTDKEEEIKRFIRDWGQPDYREESITEPPYVGLLKKLRLSAENKNFEVVVFNRAYGVWKGIIAEQGNQYENANPPYNVELFKDWKPIIEALEKLGYKVWQRKIDNKEEWLKIVGYMLYRDAVDPSKKFEYSRREIREFAESYYPGFALFATSPNRKDYLYLHCKKV